MLRKIQITNTTKMTSSRLIKESTSSHILEMTLLKQYFYGCTESTVQLVFLNKLLTCCATGSKILSIVFV